MSFINLILSSYSVIFHPDDHTIPVVTRFLANAGTGQTKSDAYGASLLLLELVYPESTQHMQYRKTHPEYTLEHVFNKMCEGVADAGMSEDEQVDALLTVFGSRLAIFNGMEADLLTRLVTALFREPLPHLKAVASYNEGFWRGMFSVIVRAHQGKETGLMGKATKKVTMVLVLHALACVGRDVPVENRNALYRTCVRAGIFNVLDEAVEGIVQLNGPTNTDDYCRAFFQTQLHDFSLTSKYPQAT